MAYTKGDVSNYAFVLFFYLFHLNLAVDSEAKCLVDAILRYKNH